MRLALALLFVAAVAVHASPSYGASQDDASDNAYPMTPGSYKPKAVSPQHDEKPPKAPCTTTEAYAKPTATAPCTTGKARPTQDALSQGDVRPDREERPRCPAPITITRTQTRTLAPETVTATRTVHDVRTATETKLATVTSTCTEFKTKVEIKTKEKPVYVTKTTTCHVTTTMEKLVTKVHTVRDVKTVTREHTVTVTHSAAALPTQEAKRPSGDYAEAKPAYGPVKSYDGGVKDVKYDAPLAMPTANPQSAYGY